MKLSMPNLTCCSPTFREGNGLAQNGKKSKREEARKVRFHCLRAEMEDGRWKMEDGRWKMEDGRWKMEDGRWKMEDGTRETIPAYKVRFRCLRAECREGTVQRICLLSCLLQVWKAVEVFGCEIPAWSRNGTLTWEFKPGRDSTLFRAHDVKALGRHKTLPK